MSKKYADYTTEQLESELERAQKCVERFNATHLTPFVRTEFHDAMRRAELIRRELAQRGGDE